MKFQLPRLSIPVPVKTLIKLIISVTIIALILRKVDEGLLWQVLREAQPLWILWAMLWFIASKVIAAFRFNLMLSTENIHLVHSRNLKLYWLCMYYNLLLPGGISGDGYKIKVLMDRFSRPFKRMVTITLLDRISGLVALGQLSLILLFWISEIRGYWPWIIPALFLSLVGSWGLFRWAGITLSSIWWKTSLQSFGVQGAQAVATLGLVMALGQGQHWPDYLLLFLISSLVAMVPMTIGGAGARELTFLYGAQFLDIHTEKAVAIGFLFYVISTAVSFFGIVYSFKKDSIFSSTSL